MFWGSKFSWVLLLIAIAGDYVVAYALALFYPHYSHTRQVMSVLGNRKSPVATLYNIWLVVLGILMSISAINFYMVYTHALAGAIILGIFGIGAGILSGLFSVNETREEETTASKIHGIGAGVGFMALTIMPLVVSFLSFRCGDSTIGIASMVFFVLSIALFALFIMSERERFRGTIIGLTGLWQRLLLASMYMPLFFIAIKHMM